MTDNPAPSQGDELDLTGPKPPAGVGLCLSGGGYRAMIFHLGTLRRLNETGWLQKLTHVASVSGGSITAAQLGLAWKDLKFENGVATNFDALVEQPIRKLASHTVDAPAILTGLLIPGRISRRVQKSYDKRLFHGKTLQDLPHKGAGPEFVVLATNLTNGRLWKFSQQIMGDWSGPLVRNPTVSLAEAVAASSAFPPVLSPHVLKIAGRPAVQLCDGGVYDNLGLEPVVKKCATVFVSDGGGTFSEEASPKKNWVSAVLRVLNTVDVEVRRLRRRQIMGLLTTDQRAGTFFAINTDYGKFRVTSPKLPVTDAARLELAATKTRLQRLKSSYMDRLVNWGYAACDAGLRSYVDTSEPEPSGFPYPKEGLG